MAEYSDSINTIMLVWIPIQEKALENLSLKDA
jgi:hypothetical protein